MQLVHPFQKTSSYATGVYATFHAVGAPVSKKDLPTPLSNAQAMAAVLVGL